VTDAQNKAPSYPWYPGDFQRDEPVQLMSLEEEGAYRRLLDNQWMHGSIPADVAQLARICKNVPAAKMRKLWAAIAPCFVPYPDIADRLYNRKLERVRSERQAYLQKKSNAGKLGAEAAWGAGTAGDGKRYCYALRRPSDGTLKIGVSRSPERRVARLSEELGEDLTLIVYADGGFALERRAQLDLASDRVGTEWFSDTPSVRAWIDHHLSQGADSVEPGHRLGFASAGPRPSSAVCGLQSSSSELQTTTTRVRDSSTSLGYAQQCTGACNRGLRENPAYPNGAGFNELVTSNQHEYTDLWYTAGIPVDFAAGVILARSREFKPNGRYSQPINLRYFDKGIREAWERANAATAAEGVMPVAEEDDITRAGRILAERGIR
jgi:uncharacterized protein YdaU (DUF1376 family)